MAVELTDPTNHDGLFDLLGKAFAVLAAVETSRRTDVPAAVASLYAAHNLLTPTGETEAAIAGVPAAANGYRASGSGLIAGIRAYVRSLTVATVDADAPLARLTIGDALAELVRQMAATSDSLDAPAVAVAVTPGELNVGDGVLLATVVGGDGVSRHFSLPESITGTVSGGSIRLRSTPAKSDLLSADWPAGSGLSRTITPQTGSGLLTNGGFNDNDVDPNAPDGWIVSVGAVGTNVEMTSPEIQTVAITGTPTGGSYLLSWADSGGRTYTTEPLAFDATASDVHAALRLLPGLESVEADATGTAPNYTHAITFEGIGGNVAQLTSTSRLTGGTPSITHGTTTGGTAYVYGGGRALGIDSAGAVLVTLQQRVTLAPLTAYALNLWAIADVTAAAGVLTIDLIDGIGGTVLTDAAGNDCSATFDAADLGTGSTWTDLATLAGSAVVFRTPASLPPATYLRVRVTTAVTSGSKVYLDRACLVAMTELYAGGPLVAAFAGRTDFGPSDRWTVAVTNDRGGTLLEWLHRTCDLVSLGVVVPTDSTGGETIPDSLVS